MNPDHRKHIQKIRTEFQASQRVKDSLNNSIQTLSRDLYIKETHFIFELIQNAEDNTYKNVEPSLCFNLVNLDTTGAQGSKGALILQNNEIGFSPENVDAICQIGKSTKSKIQGYIGEKGIGFKSVFRVTSNPYIFSNGYRFCMPECDEETGLGYIVPQWVENLPQGIDPNKTSIILPLDKPGFGYDEIEKMLQDIEPETILFLSKIKEIKIKTDTGDSLTILKDDRNNPHVQILIEGMKQGKSFSQVDKYILFTSPFEKPTKVYHEKRIGIDKRDVAIAFPINSERKISGKIFAYLPVRSDTGFPFLINTDFILPSSREEISDHPWNKWLIGCVGELLKEKMPVLKEKGLLTIDLLENLVKSIMDISENNIFYPINKFLHDAFMEHDLLPSDEGTYVSAKNAKLARGAELRNLLNQNQLRELFHSMNPLNWISGDITSDRTPDLRNYLIEQLGIEEVRQENFAERLNDDFLEKQDDQWIIKFYSLLENQWPDLWKKSNAILREKKILRLEDNSHVIPFKVDGTPNAYFPSPLSTNYPTIKRSIAEDDNAAEFLRDLEIREPDLFYEIIEFLIPKYVKGESISIEENIADLKKIQKLIIETDQCDLTDRKAKIKILLNKSIESGIIDEDIVERLTGWAGVSIILLFLKIPILHSYNGNTTTYKCPKDIYPNESDLHHYFQGNDDVWFVCDDYPDELLPMINILINKAPKITKKIPNDDGFVELSASHGNHRRGLNGFDPDIKVDGLEIAISNPTIEKISFIWNKIALPNYECIEGKIEKSSKKTYENSKKKPQISAFGELLRNTSWLPNPDGGFSKPNELFLNDLPFRFEKDSPRAKSLSFALLMRQPEREQAIDLITSGNEDFKRLIEYFQSASDKEREKMLKSIPIEKPPEPSPSFKEGLKKLNRPQRGAISSPEIDASSISDPEGYQDKLNIATEEAVRDHPSTPRKIYFSPVRNLPSNKDAREFLYEQYQGRCQVTGTTFPKASRNDRGEAENYFESCALLSYSNADYLNDAGNMLCVSADTMAKFKYASFEFIDTIDDAVKSFKDEEGKVDKVSVRIRLAGEEYSITWTTRHFMRLVALYEKA